MRKWITIFLGTVLTLCAGCAMETGKEEVKDQAQVKTEALKYLETEDHPRTNLAVMADGVHAAMRIGEDIAELQIIFKSRQVNLIDETDIQEVENRMSVTGSQIEMIETPMEGYRFLKSEVSFGTDDFFFQTSWLYEENFIEENQMSAKDWADWDAGYTFFAETIRPGQLMRIAKIQVEEGEMALGPFEWAADQDDATVRYGVMSANGVTWQEESEEMGVRYVEINDPSTSWLFIENLSHETVNVYGKYKVEIWEKQ